MSNYSLELTEKVDAKAFEGMRLLRLLKLNNLRVDGDYGLISKEIRWLCWHGFPLNLLPDEFYIETWLFSICNVASFDQPGNYSKVTGFFPFHS